MIISIINFTNGRIADEEVHVAVRAINQQISEDFEPYWSFGARLRLEGRTGSKPSKTSLPDMRGDGVIYLWDAVDVEDALGYHETNLRGIPYGFVFTELSRQLGENWTVTLSHEVLELLGDPQANLLVQGPHPNDSSKTVFHWFEMCDAVQSETYKIDSVEVSNFVLPLYFTENDEKGARNDFLGRKHGNKTLVSFGVNPGGYVGFFDPGTGDHETYSVERDRKARKRLKIKGRWGTGRGNLIRKASTFAARRQLKRRRRRASAK